MRRSGIRPPRFASPRRIGFVGDEVAPPLPAAARGADSADRRTPPTRCLVAVLRSLEHLGTPGQRHDFEVAAVAASGIGMHGVTAGRPDPEAGGLTLPRA